MQLLTQEDKTFWAMFYANLVAMDRHPGKTKENQRSLADLALIADAMLQHYHLRTGERKCQP